MALGSSLAGTLISERQAFSTVWTRFRTLNSISSWTASGVTFSIKRAFSWYQPSPCSSFDSQGIFDNCFPFFFTPIRGKIIPL